MLTPWKPCFSTSGNAACRISTRVFCRSRVLGGRFVLTVTLTTYYLVCIFASYRPPAFTTMSERIMGKINKQRVVVGGIAAGLTAFVLTGVVNGGVIAGQLQTWVQAMGGALHPPAAPLPMALWALMSLLLGFAGVWLYAAIRPRFGAGP